MMPSGHKAFLVQNPKDVELLLMHNRTYAAEYAPTNTSAPTFPRKRTNRDEIGLATPSLPASASISSPRPRLSVSRLPTPRAVSPLRLKCFSLIKSTIKNYYTKAFSIGDGDLWQSWQGVASVFFVWS
jgi:hypothetical protein